MPPHKEGDQINLENPCHARLRALPGLGALDERRRPAFRQGTPRWPAEGPARRWETVPRLRCPRHKGGRRRVLASPSTSACRISTARRRPGIATLFPPIRPHDLGDPAPDPALADWWIRMEEETRPSRPLAGYSGRTVPTTAGCAMPSLRRRRRISGSGTPWPTASATNSKMATPWDYSRARAAMRPSLCRGVAAHTLFANARAGRARNR